MIPSYRVLLNALRGFIRHFLRNLYTCVGLSLLTTSVGLTIGLRGRESITLGTYRPLDMWVNVYHIVPYRLLRVATRMVIVISGYMFLRKTMMTMLYLVGSLATCIGNDYAIPYRMSVFGNMTHDHLTGVFRL